MIFCEHCFRDKEIALIISSVSASNTGECPVCHHRDGHLYDTVTQNDLVPYFEDFHAINKQYLEKLNSEMSKSLRRSDSTLDYVPTQYIVDFIKSIEHNNRQEYDGIEYNSTTNPGGYNLAIFDPDIFECISVDVYDIEKLQYTSKKI